MEQPPFFWISNHGTTSVPFFRHFLVFTTKFNNLWAKIKHHQAQPLKPHLENHKPILKH